MNERQRLHHSQSKVVCRNFSDYGCQITEKSVSLTDSDVQTFLEEEENRYTEIKTESYIFSVLVVAFLAAKNENGLSVYLKDFFCA